MKIDNIDYSKLTELDSTDRLKASQKINSVKYEIKQSQSLKRRINKEIRATNEGIISSTEHIAYLGKKLTELKEELSTTERKIEGLKNEDLSKYLEGTTND